MHLSETQYAIQTLMYKCDPEKVLVGGVVSQYDPDVKPTKVPVVTTGMIPTPYNNVFNCTLWEWKFWYDNPQLSSVSAIIDRIEKLSGISLWQDIIQQGKVIGKFAYEFLKSPSSGGMYNMKYITLYVKLYAIFSDDICG